MNVFDLFATLSLDTSSYDEGLDKSEEKGSSFGKKLSGVVATGAKVGAAAIAATGAAVVGLSTSFANSLVETSNFGDEIDKQSQRLGISAENYQKFDYALNIAGTSMSNMSIGMKTLTNKLDDAKNGSEDAIAMFEQLGMSFEDIQNMSREEVFEQAIYGFQQMADSTERAALANDVFGRSGQELTPLFNMTTEETKELMNTAEEYGMVMSEEAVKASAGFKDSLTTLDATMTGFKNNMLSQFMPSVTTVVNGLSAVFAGDEGGMGMISEGVSEFASNLSTVLPQFIQIGGSILSSLAVAVIENAPTLIESGLDAFGMLVDALISNADMIIDAITKIVDVFVQKVIDPAQAAKFTQAAVNVIKKLADGLSKSLPILIPAIVQVVVEIVKTLTNAENIGLLINSAITLIMAVAEGLISAIPDLVSVIPIITVNLTMALIQNFPLILETLFELLGALGVMVLEVIGGLMGMSKEEIFSSLSAVFTSLGQWGSDVIAWLVDGGKNILSKVIGFFSNIGEFFGNGIENIKSKVQSGLDNVKDKFYNIFETVKTTVSNAIEFLKGLFKFEWKLPDLKLPHFSITGDFNLDPMNFSMPKISVEWYAKAMNTPYLLDDATIFGASAGRLLGAGETGKEMIYGHDQLLRDIGAVVDAKMRNMEFVVPVYIGSKKIDQQIVTANARSAVISGGR